MCGRGRGRGEGQEERNNPMYTHMNKKLKIITFICKG
jgi:hypothetical protein